MSTNEIYRDAFTDLMGYIRDLAENEETDLNSAYSRGRASGIHAVLMAIDTILESVNIERSDVGLEGLSAESWYER